MIKSRIKTVTKRFLDSLPGNSKDETEQKFRELASLLDRAVSKGVYHKNTAARKKSRLHKLLNAPKSD
jgi:small subunit ribosomal protein S20